MDSRINLVVPFDAEKVRNGFSHPEQLLPKKDKKSAEGINLRYVESLQAVYKQGEKEGEGGGEKYAGDEQNVRRGGIKVLER